MDLELTDEQRWLSESVDTLLTREWLAPEAVMQADLARRRRVWHELVEFGALTVGVPDGIGAVEACLIARALGRHLAAVPFLASAALRLALAPLEDELPAGFAGLLGDGDALALGLLEPAGREAPRTELRAAGPGFVLEGEKLGVEQLDLADQLAVAARCGSDSAFALVPARARGVEADGRASFDPTLPMCAVTIRHALTGSAILAGPPAERVAERLAAAGALLAAAEAVGAAEGILDAACRYAAERRQFGRRIAGFQALRHILADLYVRCASGWSSTLYGAAAFDDGAPGATEAASVAKAYVSRGAREVAHGAVQVFGGIAFTDEHPAHRFLRRIVVRGEQFGGAAHHERALGRALAQTALAPAPGLAPRPGPAPAPGVLSVPAATEAALP